MRRFLVVVASSVLLGCAIQAPAPTSSATPPKLFVLLVFDQLRGDYPTRWLDLCGQDGYRRLIDEGAWYSDCHFPYACTLTAPGHASFLTGCSPDRHGITNNEWWDRDLGKNQYCASTERTEIVYTVPRPTPDPKDKNPKKGGTPEFLLAESFGDCLKDQTGGRSKILAVSIKDRSACLPGGKKADAAYWFDSKTGTFATSTYYRDRPHDWAFAFNSRQRANQWFGRKWERLLTGVDYTKRSGLDDISAETAGISKKMEKTFPHPLSVGKKAPDKEYYDEVTCSPFGNELLLEFAKAAFDGMELGRGPAPDLWTLSFSCNDILGHSFGPDSQEVMDMTLRTDRIVADLLHFLDDRVGRGNYLLAFTSDHGICPIPEVSASKGDPGVRLEPKILRRGIEDHFTEKYGAAADEKSKWLDSDSFPWLYLNYRKLDARKIDRAAAAEELAAYLRKKSWALRAYTRREFTEMPADGEDDLKRMMRKAFHPVRAGDVGLVFRPYVLSSDYGSGTTHGSPHPYDTHVPLAFIGYGVKPQKSSTRVAPQSIAAVFSQVAGIKPPAQLDAAVPDGF